MMHIAPRLPLPSPGFLSRRGEAERRRRTALLSTSASTESSRKAPVGKVGGTVLAIIAVLCLSPDATLVQLIGQHRTPEGTLGASLVVTAWKNVLLGLLMLIAACFLDGGVGPMIEGLRSGPAQACLATLFQMTNQIGFSVSFLLADTATALILISLNPLWAALLGWFALGESLPCRTIVALMTASLSLGVVFAPDLLGLSSPQLEAQVGSSTSNSSTIGNYFALATGVSVALYVTVVRHASSSCPKASMSASAGLGALCAGLLSLCMALMRHTAPLQGTDPQFWLFSAVDGCCIATAATLQNLALRTITGVQCTLIMLLQTVASPVFVYIVLGVVPGLWTILGGALLLVVLATHELLNLRTTTPPPSVTTPSSPPPSPPTSPSSSSPPSSPPFTPPSSPPLPADSRAAHLLDVEADRSEELSLRERALAQLAAIADRPGEALERRLLYSLTAVGGTFIGIVFGWAALATILEDAGVYSGACEAAGVAWPCDKQAVGLTMLYTAATGGLLFGGLPAGMFADAFGAVPTCLMAGSVLTAGSLGLAFLPAAADDFFMVPLILLGVGGMLSFYTCARVAHSYPEDETFLFTMINVLFDASAGVPLIFFELHAHLGLSREHIFGGYAVFASIIFSGWAVLFMRHQSRAAAKAAVAAATAQAHSDDPAGGSDSEGGAKVEGGADDTDDATKLTRSHSPYLIRPVSPDLPIAKAAVSRQFLLGLGWFLLNALHSNTYLGTAKYVLLFLGDVDGTYMEIFTASLSAVVLFIPAISHAIETLGLAASMQAVTVMAMVHAALTLVPSLEAQMLTFGVFTVYRASTFAIYSIFITRTFGIGKLGRLLGTSNSLAALQNLLFLPAASKAVMVHLGGDWSVVNMWFLLTTILQWACVAAMSVTQKEVSKVDLFQL